MENVKAKNLRVATAKIAKATGFSRKVIRTAIKRSKEEQALRKQILSGIRVGKMDLNSSYLTFDGLLPLELPDGVRIVVLPDLHAPAHHEGIMWAVKQFLHDYQPHILILIGDVCDAFGLSAWPKGPRVPSDLNNELWEARKLIDELIEISGCERCFIIMGNHEDRARRWLMNYGATISRVTGAASHEPILSFHEMMGYKPGDKVTFIYDMQQGGGFGGGLTINDDLKFLHGYIVRPRPGASPRAVADSNLTSIVHGHTHRLGANFREILRGVIRAYEIGHLVNPMHPMMAYANMLNNWHPGFLAGEVVNGKMQGNLVPIIQVEPEPNRWKYMFMYDGKLYKGADRG
jgi:hypothetical protein